MNISFLTVSDGICGASLRVLMSTRVFFFWVGFHYVT
jgi:hypothetical protein